MDRPADIIEISDATDEEFEQARRNRYTPRTDPFIEGVLDDVEQGRTRRFTVSDEQKANARRRQLGRAAGRRGYMLDFSGTGTTVMVRKSDRPYTRKQRRSADQGDHSGQPRQRRRRQSVEPVEAEIS